MTDQQYYRLMVLHETLQQATVAHEKARAALALAEMEFKEHVSSLRDREAE